jgi:hypothetical protein
MAKRIEKKNAKKKSAADARTRDESAQTRDIERMSSKGPDPAEKGLGRAEIDARRMRTKNEI